MYTEFVGYGNTPAHATDGANAQPGSGHLVQFYEADPHSLTRNVSEYLHAGLQRGEGLIVIACPERKDSFVIELNRLGCDPAAAARHGQILFLDAQETLGEFMVNGQPEWRRFEDTITAAMRRVGAGKYPSRLRAYGEMVGVLWTAGRFSAAIRLEQFWNDLLAAYGFNLFCGYPIDIFGETFQVAHVNALLCTHTHCLSTGANGALEAAIQRSMDEVLGSQVASVRARMNASWRDSWAAMPKGEGMILWLRNNVDNAGEIIGLARQHFSSPTTHIN
ncbi:MAG TPA: MEDS domain-containing protein [Bryobacteraceae bacterium]|nr:MEDS domain-containing protein [Bryobacteraceae bacterium]